MSEEQFDLVVIGSGPGGYVAAIRAAQLGLKAACVETEQKFGGTCLRVGCIPSKALLYSSEMYAQMAHRFPSMGIEIADYKLNLATMMSRKDRIVDELTGGIAGLFKKNKVHSYCGFGSFVDADTVKVTAKNGQETLLKATNTIIATGSVPIELSGTAFDEVDVVSSTGALAFQEVPKHLVVIGGGVIGLEMGSVWSRLGSKVTVIEAAETILPMMDSDVIRTMTKLMKKQGMELLVGSMYQGVERVEGGLRVAVAKGDERRNIECDKLLVSVGRRAFTKGLDLQNLGVTLDDRGRIPVDSNYQSRCPSVYAIGDVIVGPMLAHKAEDEGVACAEIIAGKPGHVNYDVIPNIVYTWPEVASFGLTSDACKEAGKQVNIGKFPFSANGRAKCNSESDGFVKVIADASTDEIVGAHIVGPNASELIAELVVAAEFKASSEDVARSVHGHPTLSEAVKEACLAVEKRAISM